MDRRALALAALIPLAASDASGGVTFKEAPEAVEIAVGGKPFTTYRYGPGVPKPFFWPIAVPGGAAVTRAFPNVPDAPDETRDHVWHRGLSFTHGEVSVSGEDPVDFWREGAKRQGRILHRRFDPRPEVRDGVLTFGTRDDWVDPDGAVLLKDHAIWRVDDLGGGSARLSVTYTLRAEARPVVFGDSEEGSFAVRMATSLDEKSEPTGPRSKGPRGRVTNSRGDAGAANCWGRPADWVDYSGSIDGRAAGLSIFDHPANIPRARWHVRDYGLFSANPFGQKVFKAGTAPDPLTLEPGRDLVLRYAVLVHPGDVTEGRVARRYDDYLRDVPGGK